MSDVASILDGRLDECQPVSDFIKESNHRRAKVLIDVRDGEVIVSLYSAGDSGIVHIGYAAGVAFSDTAFTGDLSDAHKALIRLSYRVDCEVERDDFEPLRSPRDV
ncbi:hypothetical protein [Halorubellus salinus]|uniref:hypothetical protein n=1 Tax=Halorubellus salinus TaxID=755309 RepID=UPI001D078760|nr:hypothetical protein [Halorubellus salinus]